MRLCYVWKRLKLVGNVIIVNSFLILMTIRQIDHPRLPMPYLLCIIRLSILSFRYEWFYSRILKEICQRFFTFPTITRVSYDLHRADPTNDTRNRRPFAEIGQFSVFGNAEEEVVFMLGAVFRIIDVCQENGVWTVKLILWHYEDQDWNHGCATAQCNSEDKTHMDPTNLMNFCSVVLSVGKHEFAQRLLANHLKELELSNMTNNKAVQMGQCYHKLGHCNLCFQDYNLAIERFDEALNLFTLSLPGNHPVIAANTSIKRKCVKCYEPVRTSTCIVPRCTQYL